jgi:hypothetical protein
VWGSEFTSKDAAIQADSAEIARTLHVEFWVLVTDWLTGRELPLFWNSRAQSSFEYLLIFEIDFESMSKEPFSGILTRKLESGEMVPFLRGAMRAMASLGCEGAMRAIASSMSPHVFPQQGPTPIFSAATAGGITAVQTVSAAAKTLPVQRPQLVKGKSSQGSRVSVQIEQYLLCSAAQLTSFLLLLRQRRGSLQAYYHTSA